MISINPNKLINTPNKRFLPIPESVKKHLEPEPKFTDFTVLRQLGSGSFGHVLLVQHKITKALYSLKIIDKRNKINIQEMPYFIREIEIMYKVYHPNVVKLFGHFEDSNYCYFIMEYIPGGNIYSLVQRLKPISLELISSIMKDIISAVYFLHHMEPKIIHRDIKPENILLDQQGKAKLTDFGWSNYLEENTKKTAICGTPVYLAPEIINNSGYDEKVDIWCLGVLLFELIVGRPPFIGDSIQKIRYNIIKMKINWPNNIDSNAADLISRILKYNPDERISLEQMLLHPFFTQFFPNAISSLIKPDKSIQYCIYIISKDNPITWNPIYNRNNYEENSDLDNYENNYDDLYQKYENLKKEYNELKKAGYSSGALDSLRREIKDKKEKINQLNRNKKQRELNHGNNDMNDINNINGGNINNYNIRNNQQNGTIYFDNNFNDGIGNKIYKNNINNNNITQGFYQSFGILNKNIGIYNQNNYT